MIHFYFRAPFSTLLYSLSLLVRSRSRFVFLLLLLLLLLLFCFSNRVATLFRFQHNTTPHNTTQHHTTSIESHLISHRFLPASFYFYFHIFILLFFLFFFFIFIARVSLVCCDCRSCCDYKYIYITSYILYTLFI